MLRTQPRSVVAAPPRCEAPRTPRLEKIVGGKSPLAQPK